MTNDNPSVKPIFVDNVLKMDRATSGDQIACQADILISMMAFNLDVNIQNHLALTQEVSI